MPLGRDLSGPPVLPRIHAVSGGRLVHNPLPFPDMGPVQNLGKGERADPIRLPVRSGIRESRLEFYYYYSNFLVYGGAGSGKTKSIGKWLLSEYMRLGFAGFIYDFKDTDYTRTAYNLIKRHRYPHKFYYVSFDRPERSYRFNRSRW